MLETLADVPWQLEAQPDWSSGDEVVHAIQALASSRDGERSDSRMLYAIGNNHAGTYFPVVLRVVPFLGEILREGSASAQARTLDVLIDLLSFSPEPCFEVVETTSGPRALSELLAEEITKLAGLVQGVAKAGGSTEQGRLASELLSALRDELP
jgi:hypothetical protein